MKPHSISQAIAVGTALAALTLAGCTSTVSKGVNDEGRAQEIVFPALKDDAAAREGIFPNVENLRKIGPGVTKDDLYYLVGRPHFAETHGAREWDYVFKFRDTVDGPVTVCQYKVIFDKNMLGQSFYWKPEACAARLGTAPAPAAAPAPRHISLKADALFAFDRSGPNDIRPAGRRQLDDLARELQANDAKARIRITGYTDRLGSDAYNQRLSQQRAETVRSYLAQRGVDATRMTAEGRGERDPVVQCSQKNRAQLIACLAPNRRVDIEVRGVVDPA